LDGENVNVNSLIQTGPCASFLALDLAPQLNILLNLYLLSHKTMSNEDKARAAAAQLVIDDEPDDWCEALAFLPNPRERDAEIRRSGGSKISERKQNFGRTTKLRKRS
jgi:hypothetical protein